MKLRLFLLCLVVTAALAAAPSVILISVDGLPADYLDDPRVDLPTLRMMARSGARAERMVPVFPTVTWPNHTSLVTGVVPARHGVLGNAYFDRVTRKEVPLLHDPIFEKAQLVRVPTIYDAAHQAGLTTAGVSWPATRNAANLDWQVPFVTDTALYTAGTTPSLLTHLSTLGIGPEKNAEWAKMDLGGRMLWDWMNTALAKHILITHRPNLLLLHLDAVDAMEHRNGRDSPEAHWACRAADDSIRDLIETVRAAGLADRTTFFVVSDHGFQNYSKVINVGAILRDAGLLKTAGNAIVEGRASFVSASGSCGISIIDEPNRAAIIRDLTTRLAAAEGVATVLTGDAILAEGQPLPSSDPRAVDIIITAAPGYAFGKNAAALDALTPLNTVKGAHGYPSRAPGLAATFIAWGAAIKSPVTIPEVRTLDVAPTMAAVLGLELPSADGRVLREILR